MAAALGVPHAALKGKSFAWPELETPPALPALSLETAQTAGLLNRIDLRGLLAEYAAAEASLKREVASRYPDVTLGPPEQSRSLTEQTIAYWQNWLRDKVIRRIPGS